ncbi:MAG: hypothetical protein WC584_03010 [Candidatus Pacearchaeota archaeon]
MASVNQDVMVKYCPECRKINTFHKKEFSGELELERYSCVGCGKDFSRGYITSYDSRRRLDSFRKGFRY